jgi:hypothetical protein
MNLIEGIALRLDVSDDNLDDGLSDVVGFPADSDLEEILVDPVAIGL